MAWRVLSSHPDFVWQGRDLGRGSVGGDMEPTRDYFVTGEGTTNGLHEGSGRGDAARSRGRMAKRIEIWSASHRGNYSQMSR